MTEDQNIADHKRCFPEQYSHPLCGKMVRVKTCAGDQGSGVVERVVSSRFGMLANIPSISTEDWWRVQDCHEVK